MTIIHTIRKKVACQEYEFTIPHFFEEMAKNKMKTKTIKYDYGKCEICNTPLQEKHIKQDFWIKGNLIVVEDIPAGVCP